MPIPSYVAEHTAGDLVGPRSRVLALIHKFGALPDYRLVFLGTIPMAEDDIPDYLPTDIIAARQSLVAEGLLLDTGFQVDSPRGLAQPIWNLRTPKQQEVSE